MELHEIQRSIKPRYDAHNSSAYFYRCCWLPEMGLRLRRQFRSKPSSKRSVQIFPYILFFQTRHTTRLFLTRYI